MSQSRYIVSAVVTLLLLCCTAEGLTQVNVSIRDAEGRAYSSGPELKRHKATVFIFVATDCPNANSYAPEVARLHKKYEGLGVAFYNVYSDPGENPAVVRKHDQQYQVPFPALMDPRQSLARASGARGTPEAVVVSPAGTVLYRGRIDDRFASYGKTRIHVDQHDLRDALDEVLAGKPVSHPYVPSLGCAIPGVN